MYLWLKLFHIFFIIAWFAGLFYLPRIFVNLAMVEQHHERERLLLMAGKLYRFMHPWAIGSVLCGLSMPLFHIGFHGWVHAKILIAVLLLVYHFFCGKLLRNFQNQQNTRSHKWYRVFNELPVFALLTALLIVIFKPF
ncbi:MAG: CopD family protein [Alysiella sp.]|uniref:CopD family protein n=1 Tax=Alysiella sp. TaxID=1872483 RepID=UPI0026DB6701|nr:CopD family protein [Alysiella sp.]MDO4433182.1 CopD family protein [Alysiella sp.]